MQVWEKPISRLVAELGISDAGLRNACTRHDIPVPARGHWARLAAGQNIAATPLTELTDRAPDDEAVHAWVQVVREQLADPGADLLQMIRAEAAGEERPLWWPGPPAAS